MKLWLTYIVIAVLTVFMLHACGPSEEELRQQEQARLDSLEQVRQAQLEQMRRDSLEQVRRDSIAKVMEEQRIVYDDDGDFTVQVEAWRTREKAEEKATIWRERGYDNAKVVEVGREETGNIWYRVRIGRFANEEMAVRFQEKIREEYDAESWISRLDVPRPKSITF